MEGKGTMIKAINDAGIHPASPLEMEELDDMENSITEDPISIADNSRVLDDEQSVFLQFFRSEDDVERFLAELRLSDGITEENISKASRYAHLLKKLKHAQFASKDIAVGFLSRSLEIFRADLMSNEELLRRGENLQTQCRISGQIDAEEDGEAVKVGISITNLDDEMEKLYLVTERSGAASFSAVSELLERRKICDNRLEHLDLQFSALRSDQGALKKRGHKMMEALVLAYEEKYNVSVDDFGIVETGDGDSNYGSGSESADSTIVPEKPNQIGRTYERRVREQEYGAFKRVKRRKITEEEEEEKEETVSHIPRDKSKPASLSVPFSGNASPRIEGRLTQVILSYLKRNSHDHIHKVQRNNNDQGLHRKRKKRNNKVLKTLLSGARRDFEARNSSNRNHQRKEGIIISREEESAINEVYKKPLPDPHLNLRKPSKSIVASIFANPKIDVLLEDFFCIEEQNNDRQAANTDPTNLDCDEFTAVEYRVNFMRVACRQFVRKTGSQNPTSPPINKISIDRSGSESIIAELTDNTPRIELDLDIHDRQFVTKLSRAQLDSAVFGPEAIQSAENFVSRLWNSITLHDEAERVGIYLKECSLSLSKMAHKLCQGMQTQVIRLLRRWNETLIEAGEKPLMVDCLLIWQGKLNILVASMHRAADSALLLCQKYSTINELILIMRGLDDILKDNAKHVRSLLVSIENGRKGRSVESLLNEFTEYAYFMYAKHKVKTVSSMISTLSTAMKASQKDSQSSFVDVLNLLYNEIVTIFNRCIVDLLRDHVLLQSVVMEINHQNISPVDSGPVTDVECFGNGDSSRALEFLSLLATILSTLQMMKAKVPSLTSLSKKMMKFDLWDQFELLCYNELSTCSNLNEPEVVSVSHLKRGPAGAQMKVIVHINPAVYHDKRNVAVNTPQTNRENIWAVRILLSYLLFSIILEDSPSHSAHVLWKDIPRIDSKRSIESALCCAASEELLLASSSHAMRSLDSPTVRKAAKSLYRSLYRLSNLAALTSKGYLEYIDIYLNCVDRIAPFITSLPVQKGTHPQTTKEKAAEDILLYLSFEVFTKSITTLEKGAVDSMLTHKNLLHHRLLFVVNLLFDYYGFINPFHGLSQFDTVSAINPATMDLDLDLEITPDCADLESLSSIFRSLLWNLTHDFYFSTSSRAIANSPHTDKKALEYLQFKVSETTMRQMIAIFQQQPSFAVGLLLCLLLKEINLLLARENLVVDNLEKTLLEKFIQATSLPDNQRSCILWFLSAIAAIPYPITNEDQSNGPLNRSAAKTDVTLSRVKDAIHRQEKEMRSTSLILSVCAGSRNIFHGHIRQQSDASLQVLSKRLASVTVGSCACLMKYHVAFLTSCSLASLQEYRVCVPPMELLRVSLSVASTVLAVDSVKGNEKLVTSSVYLAGAVIQYLCSWMRLHLIFCREEGKVISQFLDEGDVSTPPLLPLDVETISLVREKRTSYSSEIEGLEYQIEADILPKLMGIFSKSSLHTDDRLKDYFNITYMASIAADDRSHQQNVKKRIRTRIRNKEFMKCLSKSDLSLAIINSCSGAVRLRHLHRALMEKSGASATATATVTGGGPSIIFDKFHRCMTGLEEKATGDTLIISSISQRWYKCAFLTPLLQELFADDFFGLHFDHLILRNRDWRSLATAVSETAVDVSLFEMIHSAFVVDHLVTFLVLSQMDAVKAEVNDQINFKLFSRFLLIFSAYFVGRFDTSPPGAVLSCTRTYLSVACEVSLSSSLDTLYHPQWRADVSRGVLTQLARDTTALPPSPSPSIAISPLINSCEMLTK